MKIINQTQFLLISFLVCLMLGISLLGSSQAVAEAKIWNDFKQAKQSGQVVPIPDFSYAGYKHGEQAVPKPDWKIFDVTAYGARPNDNIDDLGAVKQAISDAQNANGGIVFFPRGQFLLSERVGVTETLIDISGGDIILRGSGSGSGGTELFFRHHLRSLTPEKKWTTPKMIVAHGSRSSYKGTYVTRIRSSAQMGQFSFTVDDASKLYPGEFIILNLNDANAANDNWVAPYRVESNWTQFKKGEISREYHQIDKVEGNKITLKEPIHMHINASFNWEVRSIALAQNFGIEDMAFRGNWKDSFVHHKDVIHDSAWSALAINKYAHSWMSRVRFIDWNATVSICSAVAMSLINVEEQGNRGHSGIHVSNSYGVLVTHSHDKGSRGQFHSFGVSNYASGTVFHRSSWPQDTSFDAHAGFPQATLYDRVNGGFSGATGGAGGSDASQPNHMRNLIFWNFKDLGRSSNIEKDWWRSDSKYGRFLMPKMVGWHGARPLFTVSQLGLNESFGSKVEPESLYEAQLALRLGSLPAWLTDLNGSNGAPQAAFRLNNIPGKIQAEDYDKGGQSIAYHDTGTGNSGGAYRQDHVDIQSTSDTGGGYNVGWVANGEWLEFTIKNIQSGNYNVNFRVAASGQSSGKNVKVRLGNKDLGTVQFSGTGGWQAWETKTLNNVATQSGVNQVLRLHFGGGSFNLNWIEFKRLADKIEDQCNTTAQCKAIFGSGATDCQNSQSNQSVCMCGQQPCLE